MAVLPLLPSTVVTAREVQGTLTSTPPPGNWNGWPFDFSKFPHDNYGPQLSYTIWILTALAALFLALRVYCKVWCSRGLWWDDWFLIVSWVALAAQTALIAFNVTIGYGKHIWDFRPEDLTTFLLMSNTSGFFSILAAMWSKTSFALTVLRISNGWLKVLIWFIMISVNLSLGFGALSTYIQCTPSEKLWKPMMEGKCWPKELIITYQIFTAGYSGAMDIVLAILPWRIIWPLTMNTKEKVGVLLAMSMGVFAGIVSIVKVTQLSAINKFDLIDGIWLSILGTAEGAITIIAASIPILRALIKEKKPVHKPPARFQHGDVNLYTGGLDSTGRSSVVITSTSRSSTSRSSFLFSYAKYKRESDGWFQKMTESPDAPAVKVIKTQEVSVKWESNENAGIGTAI